MSKKQWYFRWHVQVGNNTFFVGFRSYIYLHFDVVAIASTWLMLHRSNKHVLYKHWYCKGHKCLVSNLIDIHSKCKNNLKPVTCRYQLPTHSASSPHIISTSSHFHMIYSNTGKETYSREISVVHHAKYSIMNFQLISHKGMGGGE